MKVTIAEIVEALNAYGAELVKVGFEQAVSPTLPERIQQHGIQLDYVPMTDDEWTACVTTCFNDVDDPMTIDFWEEKQLEKYFRNRLGVAPTLDQAKAICEANGLAVVPKEPTLAMLIASDNYRISEEAPFRNVAIYKAMLEATKEVK